MCETYDVFFTYIKVTDQRGWRQTSIRIHHVAIIRRVWNPPLQIKYQPENLDIKPAIEYANILPIPMGYAWASSILQDLVCRMGGGAKA
jgi:hypothetical protein